MGDQFMDNAILTFEKVTMIKVLFENENKG